MKNVFGTQNSQNQVANSSSNFVFQQYKPTQQPQEQPQEEKGSFWGNIGNYFKNVASTNVQTITGVKNIFSKAPEVISDFTKDLTGQEEAIPKYAKVFNQENIQPAEKQNLWDNILSSPIRTAYDQVATTLKENWLSSVNNWKTTIETVKMAPKIFTGKATQQEAKTQLAKQFTAEAQSATNALNLIPAWMAFGIGTKVAEESPFQIVSGPAKVMNKAMAGIGEIGQKAGSKVVDIAPLTEETKAIIREPVMQLFALGVQIGTFELGGKAIKGFKEHTPAEIYESHAKIEVKKLQKKGTVITPEVMEDVKANVIKSVPLNTPKVKVEIPTDGGNIKVETNHNLVMENLRPGLDKVNYVIDPKAKTNTFKWDYEKQEATVTVPNKIAEKNMAGTLGAEISDAQFYKVAEELKPILGNKINESKLAADLSSYAVKKVEGERITIKEVSEKLSQVTDNLQLELNNLSAKTDKAVQLTEAIKLIKEKPEIAQRKAPNLYDFINYYEGKTGLVSSKLNEFLVSKEIKTGKPLVVVNKKEGKFSYINDLPALEQKRIQTEINNAPKTDNPVHVVSVYDVPKNYQEMPLDSLVPKKEASNVALEAKTGEKGITMPKPEEGVKIAEQAKLPEKIEPTTTTKSSKVAESVNAKAIEEKLAANFSELAQYTPTTIKEQAKLASDLITKDIEKAKRIINGEESLPEGLMGGTMIKAMEDYAQATKDVKLAMDIAKSPLTSETSVHAQEMRMLAEREPDSAVAKIQEVVKERKNAIEKKLKKKGNSIDKAKTKIKKDINKELKKNKPKEEDWKSFIDSITCQ